MFESRAQAGVLLAEKIRQLGISINAVILAIPRGGVVVAAAISQKLDIPLSVIVVKKLGAPGNSELAIGAVTPDNIYYLDTQIIERLDIDQNYIKDELARKKREVEEKSIKYHVSSIKYQEYRHIILVDDGIATGATTLAAIKYIRCQVSACLPARQGVRGQEIDDKSTKKICIGNLKSEICNLIPKIILAVPVIAREVYDRLKSEVEKIIALKIADNFYAVGQFYRNFEQVTDKEVVNIIKEQGTWDK